MLAKNTATAFVKSDTAPTAETVTKYLDIEEKYIPVWASGTQILYYVPDGMTMRLNEDSSGMFDNFSKLTKIDTTGWNTSSVTNMSKMFNECRLLTTLDVSGFNTAKVTNMSNMFANCQNGLKSLDLSSFDTANVENMSSMFSVCYSLTSLNLSGFNTKSVKNMSNMFYRCSALTTLELSSFDTTSVTTMSNMFYRCKALTTLDLSGFNTESVTTMASMFEECTALTTLNVSKFVTTGVTNMSKMFLKCSALTSLDLSGFNTESVTTMASMFEECSALTTLNVSKFVTKSVTNMSKMFYNCKALTTLDVSGFNTAKVTNMSNMFYACSALTSLDVSKFDTKSVTNMNSMFSTCSKLTELDLSNFDTANVTDMGSMFNADKALTTIYASNSFNTTKVTSSSNMFAGCSALVGVSGTKFTNSKTDKTYARIDGGTDSPGYFSDYRCTISVPEAQGGTVKASAAGATAGTTITLTVTPETGHMLDTLTVKDESGSEVTLTQDTEDKTKYTFTMPASAVTVAATFKETSYRITVTAAENGSVSASHAAAADGKEITLTVTPNENYALDTLTVTDASENAVATTKVTDGTTYTFTMPESDVTVSATFKWKWYGTKVPSEAKAFGDIVFNDGSSTPYTASLTLTSDQKKATIAVIFYAGTELNSGDDTTTSRTLGVGVYQEQKSNSFKWCIATANAHNPNITTVQCVPSGDAGVYTFTGDKNGSDNLSQIGTFLASNSSTDDTGTATNYPAFYFAISTYATKSASHVKDTAYASDWYLPSFAELFQIWKNMETVNAAISLCGGIAFTTADSYWSSSQSPNFTFGYQDAAALTLDFSNGEYHTYGKESDGQNVCAIREF